MKRNRLHGENSTDFGVLSQLPFQSADSADETVTNTFPVTSAEQRQLAFMLEKTSLHHSLRPFCSVYHGS